VLVSLLLRQARSGGGGVGGLLPCMKAMLSGADGKLAMVWWSGRLWWRMLSAIWRHAAVMNLRRRRHAPLNRSIS